jgi:hypothetical protein
MNSRS